MSSETPSTVVNEAAKKNRCSPGKNKGRAPRKVHKSEREKLKREQLNEHFLDLACALDLNHPNNGKALILCEAIRLVNDLYGQIESLKKENASLLSESHYVSVEKNELKEENSALETQIERLQSELEARVAQSKPDLNMLPHSGSQQPEPTPHFLDKSLGLPAIDATLQQPPAVIVVPIHPDMQAHPAPTSHVSKPHARYPTPADSWTSQFLGEQLASRKLGPM